MTISTKKALDALQNAKLLTKWKMKTEHDDWRDVDENIPYASGGELAYLSDETYGKKSFLYFVFRSVDATQRAIDVLRKAGASVNTGWSPENPRAFEIKVSYFKGQRWWE